MLIVVCFLADCCLLIGVWCSVFWRVCCVCCSRFADCGLPVLLVVVRRCPCLFILDCYLSLLLFVVIVVRCSCCMVFVG